MSENLRQSLSALMDNETDELEIRRLMAELDEGNANSAELKATWSRYQMASFAMKNDLPDACLKMDVSAAVSAAIRDENLEQLMSPEQDSADAVGTAAQKNAAWLKPVSGLAIAASTAFMTFFGVTQYQSLNNPIEIASTASPSSANTSVLSSSIAPSSKLTLPATAVASRFQPAGQLTATQAVRPVQAVASSGNSFAMPVSYSRDRVNLGSELDRAQANRDLAAQRLDAYLIQHAEHAALNGSHSMMPLARVANFESQ